ALDLALSIARMSVERARRRELAELVPDRVLGDDHGYEFPSVLHGEGEAQHVRRDCRTARPRLHHPLLARLEHLAHLLHEVCVDERALLDRPCHASLRYFVFRRWRIQRSVRLLWRVL